MGTLVGLLSVVEQKSAKIEQATKQLQLVNEKLQQSTENNQLIAIRAEYEQLTRVLQLLEQDIWQLEQKLHHAITEAEEIIAVERKSHKEFVNLLADIEMKHLDDMTKLMSKESEHGELINLLAEVQLQSEAQNNEHMHLVHEHKTLVNLLADVSLNPSKDNNKIQ
ncbi:MAG: hypothetical protein ACRDAO_01345 [Culicoidibacterales bacterium]